MPEATAAIPSASGASPRRAMALPSQAVTIEAGVPGVLSRIAEMLPPKMAPA